MTFELLISTTSYFSNRVQYMQVLQGDTKERELLKCVVAAVYSWQHCGTGTLSYSNHGTVERSTMCFGHKNVLQKQ